VPFGDAVPDLFAFGVNPVKQLFFVQTEVFAVVDQRLAVTLRTFPHMMVSTTIV